ncbi:MAG TPA: methyltransferase domain-containing protein [Gaiellaceae bacterium]
MFTVAADAYDRFMGRYSAPLAPLMADYAQVVPGQRVVDVGCGPGALTSELVQRVGPDGVSAVDPSEPFVAAAKERHPDVDVRLASAEQLPFGDDEFDRALAQLVVHFMADPVMGLEEMRRVTRRGGVVTACVWDHAGGTGPLSPFWEAAHALDTDAPDESQMAGAREGHLMELFERAGLSGVENTALSVTLELASFDAWWEPFTAGVGPAGVYLARLDAEQQARLRELCRDKFAASGLSQTVRAWAARGLA